VRAFALLLAALAVGCGRERAFPAGSYRDAPIILISIDTLRADHLALYGYQRGSTPTLDRLGREALVFSDVYSHTPLTLPSHVTLFTGLLPFHHGVRDNIGFSLAAASPTLAEQLRGAGYVTGAAVSAYVLRHQTGIARGFDFYDDAIAIAGTGESLADSQRDGAAAVDSLAAWIDRQSTPRLFAFLHLYEPHTPYAPPATHRMASAYDGEVAYADELVGRLLDRLRARSLFERAIVAVVSDHGEGLNDHGESEHGIFLYREALHVPWILRLPHGDGGGRRIEGAAGLVDVPATLLGLTGRTFGGAGLDGQFVLSELTGSRLRDRTVYAETEYPRLHFGWSDLVSAVDGRYHYIRAPRPELFDLAGDPAERRNLAPNQTSTALNDWIARTTAGASPATPDAVPADVRERLKALGYIGSAPAPAAHTQPPDPKDQIQAYEALKHALSLALAGRDGEAATELQQLTREQPRMLDAWEALAKSLERTGRTADAIVAFGKVLELDPLKPETHLALARIYALQRRADRAREHASLAATRDPAAANETLAELALDAGRRDEALAFAQKSASADPTRYMPHYLLGVMAQQRGQCDQAIPAFQRAIELKRTDPNAIVRNLHAGLADCLARAGRNDEAEREFKAEIAAIPASPEARVGLATLYRSLGRDTEARDVLGGLIAATPNPDQSTYGIVVRAFTMLGDTESAREWAARAKTRFPGDPRFR